jgi:streptogramin lyase
MNRENGTFERHQYDPAHPEKLSRSPLNKTVSYDHITFIKEDASGAIWIGTSDAGINRYDPETKKVTRYQSSFGFATSWTAFATSDGIFWISTIGGELFRTDPFKRNLPFISLGSGAFSFFEDLS